MKRIALALLAASMMVTAGCKEHAPAAHHEKTKIVKRKIYHFEDGRSGYQDSVGQWWYFTQTTTVGFDGSNATRSAPTGTASTYFPASTPAGTSVARATSVTQAAPVAASERGGFGASAQTYGATGGQWAKGPAPTQEAMEKAEVTEEAVIENEAGQPETEAEAVETDAKVETENQAEQSEQGHEAEAGQEAGHEGGGDTGGHESGGTTEGGGTDAGGGGGDAGGGGGDGGGGGGGGE